jgi:methyl-accepting chemotaxis protein
LLAEVELNSPPQMPSGDDGSSCHTELLQRWMSLADIQQRVIQALVSEISGTSRFVETEAEALSGRFQRLALSAEQQMARVESLTSLAVGVEIDGEILPIEKITSLLEGNLSDVIQKILMLSKDSMSMVYSLDELNANVGRVAKCTEQLSAVNRTTNMLALNARIEAERAGTAGAAFRVVAQEIRELSNSTQELAGSMQTELDTVADGIASGHDTLRRVATIDMSDNIMVKAKLERLLEALVRRSESLSGIVSDAVREAELISADVGGMVTGLQFQDRTRQRLEHVVDTLQVIDQALDELKHSSVASAPELGAEMKPDMEWVKKLLERFTMSEMRSRFVAQLLEGKQPDQLPDTMSDAGGPSSSGSIELF